VLRAEQFMHLCEHCEQPCVRCCVQSVALGWLPMGELNNGVPPVTTMHWHVLGCLCSGMVGRLCAIAQPWIARLCFPMLCHATAAKASEHTLCDTDNTCSVQYSYMLCTGKAR
jgi:hypothetical protein